MTQRTPRAAASGPRAATDASGQADAARPPRQPPSTQRSSWPSRRVPALLTVLLLTTAVGASSGSPDPAPAVRPAQAEPAVPPDTVVRDPRAWLLLLAGRLQLIAADDADAGGASAVGASNCLHVQRRVPAGDGTLVVDSLRWIAPDGGGVVAQTQATVPAGPGDSPASEAQTDDFTGRWPAPVVSYYGPGALASPVGDPVPADDHLMADHIAAHTAAMSSDMQDAQDARDARDALVVAVLADLVAIRYLDLPQRAAVLRVLAGLPTLTAADAAGAAASAGGGGGGGAVAFHAAAGAALATVVVDAVTGSLLRYQAGTGADQMVIRFSASRCDCPWPQPRWSTSLWFRPPVFIQPADATVATSPADTAMPDRRAPQPRCPAGIPRVMFLPVTAQAMTEAAR